MTALWLPFTVPDVAAAAGFYTDRLGLTVADKWDTDGDTGVVLRAGAAYVELASGWPQPQAPLAFQLDDSAAVDDAFARWHPTGTELLAPPHRYPRGHYGFEVRGPAGAHVMIWSER